MIAASLIVSVHYGDGEHITKIPPQHIPLAMKTWWICEVFYGPCGIFIRTSIAFLMMRLCNKRWHYWVIWVPVSIYNLFSICFLFVVIFQCSPVSLFWEQFAGVTEGHCLGTWVVADTTIALSGLSAATDFNMALLPILLIKDLQMCLRTKVSLIAILSLGLVAGSVAIVRIFTIRQNALSQDFLYATAGKSKNNIPIPHSASNKSTDAAIFSILEPAVAILAASFTTLRPLFKKFYRLTSHNRSHRRSHRIHDRVARPSFEGRNKPYKHSHSTGLSTDDGWTLTKESSGQTAVGDLEALELVMPKTDWQEGRSGKSMEVFAPESLDFTRSSAACAIPMTPSELKPGLGNFTGVAIGDDDRNRLIRSSSQAREIAITQAVDVVSSRI